MSPLFSRGEFQSAIETLLRSGDVVFRRQTQTCLVLSRRRAGAHCAVLPSRGLKRSKGLTAVNQIRWLFQGNVSGSWPFFQRSLSLNCGIAVCHTVSTIEFVEEKQWLIRISTFAKQLNSPSRRGGGFKSLDLGPMCMGRCFVRTTADVLSESSALRATRNSMRTGSFGK